jgi:hypothetical protein
MIAPDKDSSSPGPQAADNSATRFPTVALPPGAEWLEVVFAKSAAADEPTWLRMGNAGAIARLLSRVPAASLDVNQSPSAALAVLMVPTTGSDPVDWVQAVRPWVDNARQDSLIQTVLLTLQGAQILWCPGRIAVIAPAERMESVCRAIVEAAYYESELCDIEKSIDSGWEDLQSDASIAFEFAERFVGRRESLATRFAAVVAIRTRYVRLMPHVLVPHVYPPTLASQIGERFRERTRMAERLDLVAEKLEVHERIYDLCSQRVSEFMVARRGHMLEWVIIILLAAQTILWFVDYLSPATVTTPTVGLPTTSTVATPTVTANEEAAGVQ